MSNIIVKETDIKEVLKVNPNVVEFNGQEPFLKEHFENRYKDLEKIIIVAYLDEMPIGYIIGYDKFQDNKESFYCWMAGVDAKYRRKGALTALMNYQIKWAKEHGYKKLKIKTRNNRRNMLSFLVKNNWYFTNIDSRENIEDNRISLEIKL